MNKQPQNHTYQRIHVISQNLIAVFKFIREFTVSLTVTAVAVALIVIVVRQLLQNTIVVQPIAVPQSMAEKGFTSQVTGQWILDQIIQMQNQAETVKDSQALAQQWQQFDMEVPGSGLSLQTIGQVLRQSLGIEQRQISGEIVETPAGYLMRFRISGDPPTSIVTQTKYLDVSHLYTDAAQHVMQMIDPFIYAAYLYASKDYANLDAALQVSLSSKDVDNQKFAYNLMGSRLDETGQYHAALQAYKEALNIDPSFAIVHRNMANTHYEYRDFKPALADYRKAVKLKRSLRDDIFESRLLERVAATLNKSQHIKKIALLEQSIKKNPNNLVAANTLAMAYYASATPAGYQKAADIFAGSAANKEIKDHEFYWLWGNVLKALGKCELAKQKHNAAFKIKPDFSTERITDCPVNP